MKILHSNNRALRGNTLLIVLIVTGLVGFTLAAYLTLLRSQNYNTVRSQAWNATIPVIEAGLEDALSQLNTHGSTNLACDGWTVTADGIYYPSTVKRTVGDNYYVITITNFNPATLNNYPIIESRGYVNMPVLVSSANQPLLGLLGSPSVTTGNSLIRGVRCTTKPEYVFAKGMVAKGQIDLKGNNVVTDSFDSSDTNYNTGGLYDKSKHKANGDVATDS